MTIDFSFFGLPNLPPTIHNQSPTGSEEKRYVTVSFDLHDDQGVDESTLAVDLVFDPGGTPVTYHVIVGGAFQVGYSGQITANGYNGYDVKIDTHEDFEKGTWEVQVYVEDFQEEDLDTSWQFSVVWKPQLIGALAVARRIIELEFDLPVIIRDPDITLVQPADRYVPVDWEAKGGNSYDAANPANYSITRPAGGNLDGAGEAVDLIVVYAEEAPTYWSDGGPYATRNSYRVLVTTDFQMTPYTDYRIAVENVRYEDDEINPLEGIEDFVGFVVSQVPRNTLSIWNALAEVHRREDREGTEDLKKFLDILHEVWSRVLEDSDVFVWETCDIDRIRPEFLDNLLYDLGNPFAGVFDLTTNQKRKLAATLVQMYREKGTCQGIVNAVRFFLGVTLSGCTNSWDDTWRLHGGSYPTTEIPTGGPFSLGVNARLGPSTSEYIWSFWLVSPNTLTADQREKIGIIAEYMKPAATHYRGILEP